MMNNSRSYEQELIDLGPSHYTQEEYEDCLHQLARIGRFLGGDRASLKTFRQVKQPETILDVGSGGGQFAIEIGKQFPQAQVVGIDISSDALAFAHQRLQESSLKNVRFQLADSPTLSFPANSFDVVTSTLVCHHLNDQELIQFLRDSYHIAKKAIIINDLHRHWLAYASFYLIAKSFFRNRLIFHDGLLSIRRSFSREDWIHYLKAAEIPLEHCSITWHWAFRWIVHIRKGKS